MWEEIACGHTDGHRLTNYYIDYNLNWRKLLGFRNMQEKLEKDYVVVSSSFTYFQVFNFLGNT